LKTFKKFVKDLSDQNLKNVFDFDLIGINDNKNEMREKLEQIKMRIKEYMASYENILYDIRMIILILGAFSTFQK